MEKFIKITWKFVKKGAALYKEVTEVEADSLDAVKRQLYYQFLKDDTVARYEELKQVNGATAISLKDASNKIIIQIKSIV